MARRKSAQVDFLDRYDLSDRYLRKPDAAIGRPGLLEGTTASGDSALIHFWRRPPKQNDADLVAIWRSELRLLHRLAGSKGAEECIAKMVDAGEDRTGFYIVVAAGQRRPLALFVDPNGLRGGTWIRQATSAGNRRLVWNNLARIAAGLEIIHGQGLIHCNLDQWSVLTSGSNEADFQLTGFEWSMRIASPRKAVASSGGAFVERRYSFLDDWRDFASLAAELLKLDSERLRNLRIAAHEVSESLSANEVSLIRELLDPPHLVQIDGDFVNSRIEAIVADLEGIDATDFSQYQLFLNLGPSGTLSQLVREASDHSIEMNDLDGQTNFVRTDLSDGCRFISSGSDRSPRYFLRGRQLVYRINQYVVQNSSSTTWEFSKCERAELAEDWAANVLGTKILPAAQIHISTFSDAKARAQRLRGRVPHWDELAKQATPKQTIKSRREDRLYRALTLLHALELVAASTDMFPVTVSAPKLAADGSHDLLVELRITADDNREKLCAALGIRSFADRLKQLLELDSVSEDEGWLLTDARMMKKRSAKDAVLQFEDVKENDGEISFSFRVVSKTNVTLREGMLVPGDFRGRLTQFGRTSQALLGLREHAELLRMLSAPRSGITSSHEKVSDDEQLDNLDSSKQTALREIVSTLPLYLVQGPPGVGKTFLVKELVRRGFAEEPASRMLLTGQSHHTVDHLMSEVLTDWPDDGPPPPLAVRCRAQEDKHTASKYDVKRQTAELIKSFSTSGLAKDSSDQLRARIEALRPHGGFGGSHGIGQVDRRALDGLVMRSANLVFATTNAKDLERLIEERGQFDWSIIEEAGKASGIELLMPLLLSHRRLMIGDHLQLPPFGSEQIARLLENVANVQIALSTGLENVERSLKAFIEDDFLALIESDDTSDELEQLCADARRGLFFFETTINDELERQENKPNSKNMNIAHVLNIQHRMHPRIAEVISRCFYKGSIETSARSLKKFASEICPVSFGGPLEGKDAPVIVVDMPYQQSTVGKRHVEETPRYTNKEEADAVVRLVSALGRVPGTSSSPSLAILSPYARQVRLLEERAEADTRCQTALASFRAVDKGDKFFNTVDAFQGNEADCVIVSLVRNNHHSSLTRALGFVSNPQRMNVLLSRAKWRLVIVGSLEFLRTVTFPLGKTGDQDTFFLREFIAIIDEYVKSGSASVIPFQTLQNWKGA